MVSQSRREQTIDHEVQRLQVTVLKRNSTRPQSRRWPITEHPWEYVHEGGLKCLRRELAAPLGVRTVSASRASRSRGSNGQVLVVLDEKSVNVRGEVGRRCTC